MNIESANGTYDNSGFTLVEIAIVLVIVGMLVAGGVSMIGPLTTLGKFRDSRENITASAEAINSWAAGNNRIPPFPPLLPDVAASGFDKIIQKPTDSWSNPLIYIYDTNLAPTGANVATKNTICGRRSTLITLTDTLVSGATISNVAYVIISRGDNNAVIDTRFGPGGPLVSSGPRVGPAITTITANTTLDIVKWVTLDELRSKAGCQGAQLKVVNNELPAGSATTTYSATILADGGVPYVVAGTNQYRWCIQTPTGVAPANMTFAPNRFSINCGALAEGSWTQATQQTITWPAAPAPPTNTYPLTIFVRDNNDPNPPGTNDNIASKTFVLTVNP